MTERSLGRIAVRELEHNAGPAAGSAAPDDAAPGVVAPGRRVTLHFALSLPGGEEIDSNFARAPARCTMGDGSLLPGFEQVLFGMRAGQQGEFLLLPEQAFGAVNADNVQRFPRYRFPPELDLQPGLMVDFSDAAGNAQAGVIVTGDARYVEIDFNHPLAGRSIRFRVHIHDVADAVGGQA